MHLTLVPGQVGLAADQPPGHRPFVDTELEDQEHVDQYRGDQETRHHEYMEGEEPGQRLARDDRPAEEKSDQPRPQDGNPGHHRRADAETPVGIRVEAHDLPGECHTQGEQEQRDPGDPGQLARVLVGTEQEDLRHVDEQHGQHEVGAPPVNGAQEPAEGDLAVERLEALPCLRRRGDVDQSEQDAGGELQHHQHEGGAPEHVPPARGVSRHGMPRDLENRPSDLEPRIQPSANAG